MMPPESLRLVTRPGIDLEQGDLLQNDLSRGTRRWILDAGFTVFREADARARKRRRNIVNFGPEVKSDQLAQRGNDPVDS